MYICICKLFQKFYTEDQDQNNHQTSTNQGIVSSYNKHIRSNISQAGLLFM